MLVQKIPAEEIKKAEQFCKPRKFGVQIFVAGAIALPFDGGKDDHKKYQVTVRIAEKEWTTGDPSVAKAKFNRYNKRPTENDNVYEAPYLNIEDIGQFYVYLMY